MHIDLHSSRPKQMSLGWQIASYEKKHSNLFVATTFRKLKIFLLNAKLLLLSEED